MGIMLPKLENSSSESEEYQFLLSSSAISNPLEHFANVNLEKCKTLKPNTEFPEKWEQYSIFIDKANGRKSDSTNKVCFECGHQSGKKTILTKHMKIVHGMIKKYQCTFCGYITSYKNH